MLFEVMSAMLPNTPPSPYTHQHKAPTTFVRLWFAWCMALLLALALPAQATIIGGTIDFGTGHSENPTLEPVGTFNGIDFLGTTSGANGWVYATPGGILSGFPGATGDAAQPAADASGGPGPNQPTTANFQAATPGDRFSIKSVKIFSLINGATSNTKVTVTGYRGATPVGSFDLTLTPDPSNYQPFTFSQIQLGSVVNVDKVSFMSDQHWSFGIDDLVVEPYPVAPVVTGISPTSGLAAGGTSVTITGTGFNAGLGVTAVSFGGTAAATFIVDSDTQITATSPAGSGMVDVTVTGSGNTSATSLSDQFTYLAAPTVAGVSPSAGPTGGGTTVVITGTGFTSATGAAGVTFGATNAANYTVNSDTQITATSPAGSAGTVDVRVTTPGGTSSTSASDFFTYVAAPTVTGLAPASGPVGGGTTVTLTGTGFSGTTAVTFGATAATGVIVNSATQITATAPAGTGTVNVRVTTVGGTSATAAANQYSYIAPPIANAVSATVAYGSTNNPIPLNVTGGAASSVAVATAASHGTATASGTTISYTPAAGYGGPDSFSYTATNASGTSAPATVTITVSPPAISYAPANPPAGSVGVAYSQSLAGASGGTGPYTYSVTSGSLPAGLSLAADGTLSGTPTTVASASFSVRATDSSNSTPPATGPYSSAHQPLTLNIVAPTITVAPATLPSGNAGTAYSQTLTASGGASPYSYAITAGALPPGVTLNTASGAITGTPTASDAFNFTITATDGNSFTGSQAYSVNIFSPNFTLTPSALPSATMGVTYNQAITAGGGTAPYTYSVVAGALPAGLTMSTAGVVSGIPTAAGSFHFTVIARDSTTGSGAPYAVGSAISLTVGAPVVAVAPATLPDGTVGTAYNQTVTASGGATPYTYAVTAGAVPGGLTLNTNTGVVSGTPIATGTFNFTISATDANAFTGSRAYAVNVVASANADLSALSTDNGVLTPGFSAGATTYSVAVMNAVSTLAITPTVATPGATVTVNGATVASGNASGPVALNVGANTITVVVTAPNGTTIKNYTLTVTRAGPQSIVDGASGMTVAITNSSPLCAFTASQFSNPASALPAPSTAYTYPYNMAGFTATQCDVGSVLTVTITFPNPVPAGAMLLKFNPAATPAWQPFAPTINGNQVVYTIQDGGARDEDGAVNGQFIDPVVLALPVPVPVPVGATGIPTLSEWSLLLLSVLAGGMGWWQLRRRVL